MEHFERISQPERVRAWLVTTVRRKTQRALQRAARVQPLLHEAQEEGTEESSPSLVDPAPLPDEVVAELEE